MRVDEIIEILELEKALKEFEDKFFDEDGHLKLIPIPDSEGFEDEIIN